ncbi:MAG: hypothetical protein MZV64_74125 [Ignavibacteriales bacterium]|nr:hypothetical protein [Ignavibacteriales bacterium]
MKPENTFGLKNLSLLHRNEAEELIEIAERKNLKIFVDHTFIYNGAVIKIKELIDKDELGNIIYFDSERINLGLFQRDVNVVWDLAPHDLSIMTYLLNKAQSKSTCCKRYCKF